jgi:hypothetical protein
MVTTARAPCADPGESYSDVILRIVESEGADLSQECDRWSLPVLVKVSAMGPGKRNENP